MKSKIFYTLFVLLCSVKLHAYKPINGYDEARIAADVASADSLYKLEEYSKANNLLEPIAFLDFDEKDYPPSLPTALHLLGKVLQYGFDDCEHGRQLYEACVEDLDYTPAYYDLGQYWWGNNCSIYHDCAKGFQYWLQGARKGDAKCQYEVAYVYSYGLTQAGIRDKDFDKGAKYLKMALKQNYPDAYWLYGIYLRDCVGGICAEYYPHWLDVWIEGAKLGSYKCAESIHYDQSGEHQFCKQFGLHN